MARALHWLRYIAGLSTPKETWPVRTRAVGERTVVTTVLAIGLSEVEQKTLEAVASAESWDHFAAGSVEEGLKLLSGRGHVVILLDRDGCGANWRTAMEQLAECAPSCCVVLISRVNDEYLWQEVVQRRGFDVINKPFHRDHLRQGVERAWLYCRLGASDRKATL